MHFLSTQITISFILLSLLAQLCTSSTSSITANRPILRPIRIAEDDKLSHLEPRGRNSYSKLDLQNHGQMAYGISSENAKHFHANMTLYAPNGMLMVLLEQFDHLTSAIDCQGDDGTMSLTFESPKAYQYALQAWGHINAKADDKFLLIANHQGCGPDEQRQAYIVTSVKEDNKTLTTYLAAETAPWSEVGGTYDLDFTRILAHPSGLRRRNWFTGDFDEVREFDLPTKFGDPEEKQTIWHDDNRLLLDCVHCFVDGGFHVAGHIKTNHWEIKEGSLAIEPRNFSATMELQAVVTYLEKKDELSGKKELFSFPVPELGFEIEHLCKLGLTVDYNIGFSTKLSGSATLLLGATSTLPDGSLILVDLKSHDKSQFLGFDNAAVTPILDVTALSGSVKFAVFTQADVTFGFDFEKIEKFDVQMQLKLPQLAATFNAGYKEGGFCNKEKDALTTGAKVTTTLGIELWLEIFGQFLKKKRNFFSHKFYNLTHTIDEECLPIPIKNLIEDPSQTDTEPLPIPTELIPSDTGAKEGKMPP